MSIENIPLQNQMAWMLRLRRWGEKLMLIPLIFAALFAYCKINGDSLFDINKENSAYYPINVLLLLMWFVLLFGVLLAMQIFRTAYTAFGFQRAAGYFVLATLAALIALYFIRYWFFTLHGSLLVYLLWPGLFLVPSLIQEEVRRRLG